MNLRGTLDEILLSAARDLRKQADVIDRVLAERISCMDEMRQKLENDLKEVCKYYETSSECANQLHYVTSNYSVWDVSWRMKD